MKTHTPGPWRVGDAGKTVFGPKMPDGSAPVIIANCDYQQTRMGGSKQANAALISAAPELLAALEDLLASTVANHLPGIPALDDAQHAALDAIAKAKGQA